MKKTFISTTSFYDAIYQVDLIREQLKATDPKLYPEKHKTLIDIYKDSVKIYQIELDKYIDAIIGQNI